MKYFLFALGFVVTFVAGVLFAQKYNLKIESKNRPSPTSIIPNQETSVPTATTESLPSPTSAPSTSPTPTIDDNTLIKNTLAQKHGWNPEDIIVTISKNDGNFARGSIKEKSEVSGGMFLAAKIAGQWEIVFEGNGIPNCNQLKTVYLFPASFLTGICD